MHKKYHEKFKILDILAVTTQAREGIETRLQYGQISKFSVTTQAREGIETSAVIEQTKSVKRNNSSPRTSSACPRQKNINSRDA